MLNSEKKLKKNNPLEHCSCFNYLVLTTLFVAYSHKLRDTKKI